MKKTVTGESRQPNNWMVNSSILIGDMSNASSGPTAVSENAFNEARLQFKRSKSVSLPLQSVQGTYIVIEADLDMYCMQAIFQLKEC